MACAFANDGNNELFVKGDEDYGVDGREDRDGTWGDFEVVAEFAVGFDGLADEQS